MSGTSSWLDDETVDQTAPSGVPRPVTVLAVAWLAVLPRRVNAATE